MEAFAPYWPGEIVFDEDKEFFKFIGNGKLLMASPWSLLNPFNTAWGRIMTVRDFLLSLMHYYLIHVC